MSDLASCIGNTLIARSSTPPLSTKHPSSSLLLLLLLSNLDNINRDTIKAHALQQILGVLVDVELAGLGVLSEVERRNLGHILIFSFSLFFLELEGDTSDWTSLDTLHQVGGVAGDLRSHLLVKYSWKRV